ncbi:MAG TPA: SIR2 family NAD-dependent protein deacylase [Candidatus Brocadiaceae bacterium]
MATVTDNPKREDVLKFISSSASYGNLGLFVGAGFCKAVLNDDFEKIALSWRKLLNKASEQLEIDYAAIQKEGAGYPEIASRICQAYADNKNKTFSQGASRLKQAIASLTCWYPDRERMAKFGSYLDALSPSWVITTNYDLVIEGLLTGRSIPLGPNDLLTNPRGIVPVYHLHGIRTSPEEIIITQEDYVSLFRPNEYRQIKLALTVKESTTLLIGYGLGDVNVLTALDWSNNVFLEEKRAFPHDVIQIVRKKNPKQLPYRDRSGILVIETSDLVAFFEEYMAVRAAEKKNEEEIKKDILEFSNALADPTIHFVDKFIDDEQDRKETIRVLSHFPIHLVSGFISFLDKCIDETWKRSEPNGAFEGYNQNLSIILDILTLFDINNIPPALFQTAAYGLQRVGCYVGKEDGKSRSAEETWRNRKGELSKEMVKELTNVADQHSYHHVKRLLHGM